MHIGKQRLVDGLDDGSQAVKEQPHGSMERFISRGSPFDPLVKGLSLRPLGKKKNHAIHSARGASSPRSNLCTWIRLLVDFNLTLGRVIGKLLGCSAGFGLGPKRRGVRLGRFLPKPKSKVSLQLVVSEGAGLAPTIVLGCSSRPELTSLAVSGVVPGVG